MAQGGAEGSRALWCSQHHGKAWFLLEPGALLSQAGMQLPSQMCSCSQAAQTECPVRCRALGWSRALGKDALVGQSPALGTWICQAVPCSRAL